MSLGERFVDVNLLDSAADKMNQNVISICQSMVNNEEQHLITRKRLSERERERNSRLIRRYGTIEDLLCSSTNEVDVEEDMNQFNDLPKMLIDVHQGYNQLLDDDKKEKDDECFD